MLLVGKKLIVTHVMGELGMAMYVADASGQIFETVTPGKKKEEPAPKNRSKGGLQGKQTKKEEENEEFVKPRVEEIVAVEETPGPDEIPIVEEPDDDTEQILEPAKTEKQL